MQAETQAFFGPLTVENRTRWEKWGETRPFRANFSFALPAIVSSFIPGAEKIPVLRTMRAIFEGSSRGAFSAEKSNGTFIDTSRIIAIKASRQLRGTLGFAGGVMAYVAVGAFTAAAI